MFALAIVAGHLVLAPVTLVVAVVLAVAGRVSRWRLWWLLLPAGAGLAWMIATGPGAALAGFTAWPSGILGSLHGHLAGPPASHQGHPPAALRAAWSRLPGQLPVALICGATEAAVLGWLVWLHTDGWAVPPPRPGALAAVRGRVAGAAIRAGAVLTRDGCALGVVPATGAIAELSWSDMCGGLLITGDDPRDVTLASLQVVHAALRRRKPLIVIGPGGPGGPSDAAGPSDAGGLGRALTAACLATGTPLRTDGSAAGVPRAAYGVGVPGAAYGAGVTDAAHGAGVTDAAYGAGVTDAAHGAGVTGAAGGARAPGGADTATGTGGASASGLWGRARGGLTQGSQAVRTAVDPHQVIMERSAAWLPADSPETAARACADLTELAQRLRAIGVDGDGLVWIPRGELVTAEDLATLLRVAPDAGLLPLIGVTSHAAANLAGLAGATLIHRIAEPALAARLAELTGTWMLPAPAAAALAGSAAVPMPTAVPAPPATFAAPGVLTMPGTELVRCPVIPPRTLHALRRGEFLLAVNVPRRRLIALGRLIPARLPRREEPPRRAAPDRGTPRRWPGRRWPGDE